MERAPDDGEFGALVELIGDGVVISTCKKIMYVQLNGFKRIVLLLFS